MPAPKLTNRKRFTTSVKNGLHEHLQEMSAESLVPISKMMDEAIEDFIKKKEKEKAVQR